MMCWIVQIQCKVSLRWVPSSKFLLHILPFVNTSHRWISYRFVSRAMPRDTRNHVILGLQQFKPTEFAQQMNLNMENAWGILRCILDIIKKLDDGKYLIMRDPNKVRLLLTCLPAADMLTCCCCCLLGSNVIYASFLNILWSQKFKNFGLTLCS